MSRQIRIPVNGANDEEKPTVFEAVGNMDAEAVTLDVTVSDVTAAVIDRLNRAVDHVVATLAEMPSHNATDTCCPHCGGPITLTRSH